MSFFYAAVLLIVWNLVSTSALCQLNSTLGQAAQKENNTIFKATQSCEKEAIVIEKKVPTNKNRDYLKYSSLVYGLLVSIKKEDVGNACYMQAKNIIKGIKVKESWAFKVLDASGNVESGFMFGNNHWLGSKTTCESVNTPYTITMSKRFKRNTIPDLLEAKSPISFQYRLVYARHASPWQIDMKFCEEHILHIGLCLPTTCSNRDVHNMMQAYFQSPDVVPQLSELEVRPQIMQVKDMKLRERFYLKYSVLSITLITLLSIGVACLAYIIESTRIEEDENKLEQTSSTMTSTTLQADKSLAQVLTIKRLVLHFSARRNLSWLYDTTNPPEAISIMFGMKSIACFVIMAYHTQWYGFFSLKNTYQMIRYSEDISNQWLSNAPLLVDLFFVVSGFLLSHSFLRNKKQIDVIKASGFWRNVKLFGKIVLQRYLRLAPLYFIVLIAVEIFTSHIVDTSYFFVHERFDLNCQRYWWRNILFIQNFFPINELCASWSWSLACEMQYFVLFLSVLFIYAKNEKVGLKVFFTFASVMFVLILCITMRLKFVPSLDVLWATGQQLYTNTFTRMSPYFPGIAGGWFYTNYKGQSPMSMKSLRRITIFSLLFIWLTMHSTVKRDGAFWLSSTIYAVGRWVYATSIISLILANTFGYQNMLTRFFSAKFFVHISKLEYGIYLLNPLVVMILCGFSDTSQFSHPIVVLTLFLAVAVITYVLAVLFAVLFELPFSKLINEVFARKQKV